jgi:hypothetical protein
MDLWPLYVLLDVFSLPHRKKKAQIPIGQFFLLILTSLMDVIGLPAFFRSISKQSLASQRNDITLTWRNDSRDVVQEKAIGIEPPHFFF